MEENLHKDPLENLFRKNLEDPNLEDVTPGDDHWDVPSDKVWDGVNSGLEATAPVRPKPIVRSWRPAAIAALLLVSVGVLYCFYSYQQQLNILTKQVEELTEGGQSQSQSQSLGEGVDERGVEREEGEMQMQAQDQSLSQSQSFGEGLDKGGIQAQGQNQSQSLGEGVDERGVEREEGEMQMQTQDQSLSQSQSFGEGLDKGGIQAQGQNQSQSLRESQSLGEGVDERDLEQLRENSLGEPVSSGDLGRQLLPLENNATLLLEEMPALPPIALPLLESKSGDQVLNLSVHPIIVPVRAKNQGLYAGLSYVSTKTSLHLKRMGNPPFPMPDTPSFEKGKSILTHIAGLKLGYAFSDKWAVEVEGQYGQNTHRSRHSVRLRYSRNGERPIDGQRFESNYNYSIPTAYGEVDADISLYRESNTSVDEAEAVKLELKSTHKTKVLNIPVIVKYRFGNGPLRLTAKTGIAANFVLSNQTEITTGEVNRRGLSHHRTKVFKKERPLKKTNFDYIIGMGVDYQIAKNWRATLEPTFSRSLNPIFNEPHLKTFPIKTSLALGVNYQF